MNIRLKIPTIFLLLVFVILCYLYIYYRHGNHWTSWNTALVNNEKTLETKDFSTNDGVHDFDSVLKKSKQPSRVQSFRGKFVIPKSNGSRSLNDAAPSIAIDRPTTNSFSKSSIVETSNNRIEEISHQERTQSDETNEGFENEEDEEEVQNDVDESETSGDIKNNENLHRNTNNSADRKNFNEESTIQLPNKINRIEFESKTTASNRNSINRSIVTEKEDNAPTPESFTENHGFIDNSENLGCDYETSINTPLNKIKPCQYFTAKFDTCKEGSKYYNKSSYKSIKKCDRKVIPNLCTVTSSENFLPTVECKREICKSSIKVGFLDDNNGEIKYKNMQNMSMVEQYIIKLMNTRKEYAFFSCMLGKMKKLQQIFIFPPWILQMESKSHSSQKLNINIFVLDSVSRQHFYRILPNTVRAMRSVNSASSTTVLDFQGFQSLAPFTYVNLQALFSGDTTFESVTNRRYNFEDMFHSFQSAGYDTMLQEDACWHDEWGSLLTGNRKLNHDTDKQKLWQEVNNITSYYGVNSLGLTHISCHVLSQHGDTNSYSSNDMACFDGKQLSLYLVDHLKNQLARRKIKHDSKPLFSYTHINVAHERSGIRLKSIDHELAEYVTFLANSEDTLSILFSDHGGKTNQYSMDTMGGRFEIYDPFLFMIVPPKFRKLIGKERYENLEMKQNFLVTVQNVRETLLDILTTIKKEKDQRASIKLHNQNNSLLLTASSASLGNCQGISIRTYGLCKCVNDYLFPDPSDRKYQDFLQWLGEFALGKINNRLSNEQGGRSKGHYCERIIGNHIENIILKKASNGNIYIFDIASTQTDSVERFNVHVFHNIKRIEQLPMLRVEHWQRISFYSKFSTCKDHGVSIELCICQDRKKNILTGKYFKNSYMQFKVPSRSTAVGNLACLFLLTRDYDAVISFEIVNLCEREIKISFGVNMLLSWESAKDLPIEAVIRSHKILYVTSFYRLYAGEESVQPQIDIQ